VGSTVVKALAWLGSPGGRVGPGQRIKEEEQGERKERSRLKQTSLGTFWNGRTGLEMGLGDGAWSVSHMLSVFVLMLAM
jgi:hypothetical protein